MLLEYVAIAVLFVLTAAVGIIAVSLGTIFGPKRETKRKQMPYESGMVPVGKGTRRMPVRFYLVAVLFILFDIEVIFFLPWAVSFRKYIENGMGTFIFIEMLVFIGILLIGYIYAWKKGAFEWE